jgi:hypothetical protein
MKNLFLFFMLISCTVFLSLGCASREITWDEATQDLERGLTGKGRLVEKSPDDVDAY